VIKAIETKYKGYRFRSRLEARWAVFFDAMGFDWAYEPEGFDLGKSGWYLPDFVLAHSGTNASCIPTDKTLRSARCHFFIEIKGSEPTEDEVIKLVSVCEAHTCYGGILFGDIPSNFLDLRAISIHKEGYYGPDDCEDFWDWLSTCGGRTIETDEDYFLRINNCLTIARSARFEHGETPR
jgi:hypothetical protein